MNRRAEILEALVRNEQPSEPLMRELRTFGWDWSEGAPLVVLKKEHLIRVIDQLLAGELTAAQLQEWAENLEAREDVAFDQQDDELLDDVFFRIAAPFINEPLTSESVRAMRAELTKTTANQSTQPTPKPGG